MGWGPWVINAEIWLLSNRAYGIALGSGDWMCNFIVGQITPIMLQKLKYGISFFRCLEIFRWLLHFAMRT